MIKKFWAPPAYLGCLILFVLFMVGCGRDGEATQSAAASTTPSKTAVTADARPSATFEPEFTATYELIDVAAETEVVSVVITAAEATLFGGPGEDYPVVATVFGGLNYPVSGVSEDGLWWRLTCFDDAAVVIDDCWVSADPAVTLPTDSTTMLAGSDIKPYIELTFNFLRAVQSGLTAAGSEEYLNRDLQTIVEAGRPLPTLFGIHDVFPSMVLTDFSDPARPDKAQVRVRFNFDSPTYAIVTLIQEEGIWQIDKVAAHNLVKTFSTNELIQAEDAIISYFEALASDEPKTAFDILTSDAQESTTLQAMSIQAEELETLKVTTMQPIRSTADQIVYYVRLFAALDGTQSGDRVEDWQPGENVRWLTLVQEPSGWHIAQIINSPILADISSWQRVNVLPINMNLDIPSNWTRAGIQWAWSPTSLGIPGIGVSWVELNEFGGDEILLPRFRREISNRPIDLGWSQGTQYTFELMGSPGEGSTAAETHVIVRTGRRAYDFYALANSVEELDNIQPILQRMVAAVSINDPQASAYNSVETSVDFLATLMRDGTAASSLTYLSENLKAKAGDQLSVLTLLGADTLFHSFNASWLENPAAGQALVSVTLNYPNASEELLFTVESDSSGIWRIIAIEPLGNQAR